MTKKTLGVGGEENGASAFFNSLLISASSDGKKKTPLGVGGEENGGESTVKRMGESWR